MAKTKQKQRKAPDPGKILRTKAHKAARAAAILARKTSKPQPIPQAGRATRRMKLPK